MRGKSSGAGRAIAALVAFNAKACEEAVHPRCVCACGGAMHGMKHPRSWVKSTAMKIELEALGAVQLEVELNA